MKKLVSNGQIEFVDGGYVDPDEATPNFDDMLNNLMVGRKFLHDTFGVVPKVGWDIDAFGHSDENTRLLAELGYDAMFFSRMDEEEKSQRSGHQAMNFLWRPSTESFGNRWQVLTSVFKADYCSPEGLLTGENYQADDLIETDRSLSSFNADEQVHKLVEWSHAVYRSRKGQNVLLPAGCDFSFQNAFLEYSNLERLIDYANANNKYNITFRMSTPSEFITALKDEHQKFPVRTGDMFPYANKVHDFWSGYYTSRPGGKKQVRDGSALFNAEQRLFTKALLAESRGDQDLAPESEILAAQKVMLEQLSTYLHHDAITGTEKEFVALDYTRRLGKAIE